MITWHIFFSSYTELNVYFKFSFNFDFEKVECQCFQAMNPTEWEMYTTTLNWIGFYVFASSILIPIKLLSDQFHFHSLRCFVSKFVLLIRIGDLSVEGVA